MNLGAVIERVQQVGDLLEKLIQQSNELRERVIRLEQNTDETSDRVAVLEAKLDRQTALVEAVARDADVDPEAVYAAAGLDGPVEDLAGENEDERDETDGDDAADVNTDAETTDDSGEGGPDAASGEDGS